MSGQGKCDGFVQTRVKFNRLKTGDGRFGTSQIKLALLQNCERGLLKKPQITSYKRIPRQNSMLAQRYCSQYVIWARGA